MSFRVTGSKLAIIPIEDSPKIGLIHVPETSRQRTDQGIVAYIGPDCRDFAPGQYVIFSGHSGTIVYIQNPEKPEQPAEKLILMDEKFVFGEIIDFEDTTVPGLYFKSKGHKTISDIAREISDILTDGDLGDVNITREDYEQKIRNILQAEDKYFEASYELAIAFIADAIKHASWRQFNPVTGKGINVVTPQPTKEELTEVLRG
jgi:hypothetical protein